jgi:hypothetical protein
MTHTLIDQLMSHHTMKITIIVLFILCAGLWTGSAFGQAGVSVLSEPAPGP